MAHGSGGGRWRRALAGRDGALFRPDVGAGFGGGVGARLLREAMVHGSGRKAMTHGSGGGALTHGFRGTHLTHGLKSRDRQEAGLQESDAILGIHFQ
jgi:hypothetical protein